MLQDIADQLYHMLASGTHRLKYSESDWIGTRVPVFLKAVFDVLPGIREGFLEPLFLHNIRGKEITTN